MLPKVLFIVGPTASGKTSLGLLLAKRFDGEIVNADARQLYKDFSIGTGKPECESEMHQDEHICWVDEIPHYLMDAQHPNETMSVAEYKRLAEERIQEILSRGKLPIVVGGTGLYISALIDQPQFPEVAPNHELRSALEKVSLPELVAQLRELDDDAEHQLDIHNPRRVIRAIEILKATGKTFAETRKSGEPKFDALQLGLHHTPELLRQRIETVIQGFFERGWLEEVKRLLELYPDRQASAWSSIGYPELVEVLQGKADLEEVKKQIRIATWHYAKRQMTWFKRDQRIHWLDTPEAANAFVVEWLAK